MKLLLENLKESNEILMFAHSKYCNKLIIDIVNYWSKHRIKTKLVIVDLNDHSIIKIEDFTNINKVINTKLVNHYLEYCGVTAYPSFCVYRNGKCKEYIYGTYNDIIKILRCYL